MKRSPPSSSSSSSSSSIGFENPIQKRGAKSTKKNLNVKPQNLKQKRNQTTNGGSRRSSIYRGVTRHRWTGRFEAHLWDKSSWNNIQNKKGKQVYLGAYDTEEAAARTYDLAALKYWGKDATLNFPIETYGKEFEEMDKASKEEYLASLRRQSSGFSRGISKYRGVARHHHNGRWEARIGRVCGNKYLYLGTYKTQEEAAVAYDMAAIEYRGTNAVTNFDISNYIDKLKKKNKNVEETEQTQPETTTITEIVPNNSSDSEETSQEQTPIATPAPPPPPEENLQQAEPCQQQVQQQQQQNVGPVVQEHTLVNVMDIYLDQDLPWSYMYNGLLEFQDTNMSFSNDKDLIDIFDGTGFVEDIGLMFNTEEPCVGETDINISEVLEGIDLLNGNAENMVVDNNDNNNINKEKEMLSLESSSSPSSSTTTVSL